MRLQSAGHLVPRGLLSAAPLFQMSGGFRETG